jgi:hypothetical protein
MCWSEAGIGWVPSVLERCDRMAERHQHWAGKRDLLPSEIFRTNMYSCMVDEPIGLKLWELIGADNIVCETDYPHSDTSFPHSQKVYEEVFDGIPAGVVEKVCHENAERIFNWKMADPGLATVDTPWSPPPNWSSQRAKS